MLPEDFEERLERTRRSIDANCISTSNYLIGFSDSDTPPVEVFEIEFFDRFQEIDLRDVEPGDVVCWEDYLNGRFVSLHHMGVVRSIDPVKITHRNGSGARLIEFTPLQKAGEDYWYTERRFYRPR